MDNHVLTVAKAVQARKYRELREEAERRAQYLSGRRRDARARGYRGPLTREEAARQALRNYV
jgi:hypothetical protein